LEFGNTSIHTFFKSRAIGRWIKPIELCLKKLPGVWLEDKKLSLSIHYRQAQDVKKSREILLALMQKLSPQPHLIFGKQVINLLPHAKVDKGTATLKLMKKLKCSKVLFVGDDETDEYALKIRKPNFLTVRIGRSSHSGAKYFLKAQNEIKSLFKSLINIFSAQANNNAKR
jgi:trehalose 6-phosphate phosphatase